MHILNETLQCKTHGSSWIVTKHEAEEEKTREDKKIRIKMFNTFFPQFENVSLVNKFSLITPTVDAV